jgi:ferredoxin
MSDHPRLRIDPTACDGVGICQHLAPALIHTDSWGYPIIASARLDAQQARQARRAATACPRRALYLEDVDPSPAPPTAQHPTDPRSWGHPGRETQ